MNTKIKITFLFNYWKDINNLVFNITIDINRGIEKKGFMFYNLKNKKHGIDIELKHDLRNLDIDEKIIINALNERYYNFEILPKTKQGINPILILS